MNFTRNMRHYATYWQPMDPSEFNETVYGDPVVIRCRWQDMARLFRAASGDERTSSAVVYVDRPLQVGGMLMRGDLSGQFDSDGFLDPRAVDGPRRIEQVEQTSHLKLDVVLNKVYL